MSISPNTSLIMDSFGWAVLHSLWQGALAGIAVWLFSALTKPEAARARFGFGFAVLCTLLLSFIATFSYYYMAGSAVGNISSPASQIINFAHNPAGPNGDLGGVSALMRLTQYTNIIGILWLAGFTILGLRYVSAFAQIHKLRTTGLSALPSNWDDTFNKLVTKAGVNSVVRAYISDRVASPITFGIIKPVVLFPAWFFTGLSGAQCEAIILHELAHIRRCDYVTNIVQIIVKTVFFYHPAVQYIAKTLDTDREHACDDFAVHVTKSPENLAIALGTVRMKAARSAGVLALAADGPDTPLMHRLKRLVGGAPKQTNADGNRGAALTLVAGAASVILLSLGASNSGAHPEDITELAGAPDQSAVERNEEGRTFLAGGSQPGETIIVHGKTYTAGTQNFDYMQGFGKTYNDDRGRYVLINGKKYAAKYSYNLFSNGGQTYVVKQKNNKRYIEVDGSWHRIDGPKQKTRYHYSEYEVSGQTYKTRNNSATHQTEINVNGQWYDIDNTDLDALLPSASIANIAARANVEANVAATALANAEANIAATALANAEANIAANVEVNIAPIVITAMDPDQIYMQINGSWYNVDDPLIDQVAGDHTQDNANAPYTYNYAQKYGNNILIKTHIDTGKTYAQISGNWQNVPTSGGGDHGHRHVKIKGKWVNIETSPAIDTRSAFAMGDRPEVPELPERPERPERAERAAASQASHSSQSSRSSSNHGNAQRPPKPPSPIRYEAMRDQLIPMLTADGFLSPRQTSVTMEMNSKDIFINGTLLPQNQEAKYCKIVSEFGMRTDSKKRIVIMPDSFEVSTQSDHGNTRVTYGAFTPGPTD